MSELWQLGARELAALISSGEATSRAVVEAHLARIDEINPHLNAIVRRIDDEALRDADEADRVLAAGRATGPLHGVPFTVKENIDVAGTPTTQGVPALADAIADRDAPVVERMRAAGAIPIARTNLPDLGLRVHTHSALHGLTRNPWHPGVTAGGSSGGEASAIASGMSPIGLGNDIGGSLRNPAHCCGIASIKPTAGVVPFGTVIPPEDHLLATQLMACEGPLARRVGDVRSGLLAIAGWSARDPRSVPATLTDLEDHVTVAVMPDPPGGETHSEIADAVRRAGDALADAGHRVVEATPPGYETALELWADLLIADLTVGRPLLELVLSTDAVAVIDALMARYDAPSLQSSIELHGLRYRTMRAWSEFFTEHQVLLSPTWALPAFEHDADLGAGFSGILSDTLRPVLPANVLGLPAAVVPAGLAAGLPVGVQVIGDRFTDLRCLTIAESIESATGGSVGPIDPVTS